MEEFHFEEPPRTPEVVMEEIQRFEKEIEEFKDTDPGDRGQYIRDITAGIKQRYEKLAELWGELAEMQR